MTTLLPVYRVPRQIIHTSFSTVSVALNWGRAPSDENTLETGRQYNLFFPCSEIVVISNA